MTLYLPGDSCWHRLAAGRKLCLLLLGSVLLSSSTHTGLLLLALGLGAAVHAQLGARAWHSLRWLWAMWPWLLLTWGFFAWQGQWQAGLQAVLRIVSVFLLANWVTLTTRMDDLLAALTPLLKPLQYVGITPRSLAFSLALLLRAAPQLYSDHQRLQDAWRARSPRPARWRLLPTLFILTLKNADASAEALAARGGQQALAKSSSQEAA